MPLPSQADEPSLQEDDTNLSSKIIDLSQAFEAYEAILKTSGSYVSADPKHSALTLEVQMHNKRNKQVSRH